MMRAVNDRLLPPRHRQSWLAIALLAAVLNGCGGGGGGSGSSPVGTDTTPATCTGNCADDATHLSVTDVEWVIAQAVAQGKALGVNATIAVVDRVQRGPNGKPDYAWATGVLEGSAAG